MKAILKFITSWIKRKMKPKTSKGYGRSYHYIAPPPKLWNVIKCFVLFSSISVSASTVNWQVTDTGNGQNRIVYGLIGDTAFQNQVIDSIRNNTFSSLISNNSQNLLGNYIVPSTTGYVKSGNFTIGSSIKNMSVFLVEFNSVDPNSYSYADVSAIISKTLNKRGVNTFTFNLDSSSPTRIYSVPEPNVICLLSVSVCIVLTTRPNRKKSF
jgi:hypothetical protein